MNTISLKEPQLVVSVSDPALLTKLKNAIKMLNGVTAISVLKPQKSDLDLAHEDVAAGRVTHWTSADEMFDTVWEKVPNEVTLAAMKEAENGDDAGPVSTDSLESFIASMQ